MEWKVVKDNIKAEADSLSYWAPFICYSDEDAVEEMNARDSLLAIERLFWNG